MVSVNQLIIIGGPSGAGKTTLIKNLQQGGYPQLCEQLGITAPSSWPVLGATDTIELREPMMEKLIVHYDVYKQFVEDDGFNHLSELVANAGSITILTLCVPPKILVRRNVFKFFSKLRSFLKPGQFKRERDARIEYSASLRQQMKKIWGKIKAYREGHSVFLYDRWFAFFSQRDVTAHWVLDYSKLHITKARPCIIENREIRRGVSEDRNGEPAYAVRGGGTVPVMLALGSRYETQDGVVLRGSDSTES
jgi:hypothetical protein